MNQTYKSIFNPATGSWVAVSETTRSRGKRASAGVNRSRSVVAALSAMAAAVLIAVAGVAEAATAQVCVLMELDDEVGPPSQVPGSYICSGDVMNDPNEQLIDLIANHVEMSADFAAMTLNVTSDAGVLFVQPEAGTGSLNFVEVNAQSNIYSEIRNPVGQKLHLTSETGDITLKAEANLSGVKLTATGGSVDADFNGNISQGANGIGQAAVIVNSGGDATLRFRGGSVGDVDMSGVLGVSTVRLINGNASLLNINALAGGSGQTDRLELDGANLDLSRIDGTGSNSITGLEELHIAGGGTSAIYQLNSLSGVQSGAGFHKVEVHAEQRAVLLPGAAVKIRTEGSLVNKGDLYMGGFVRPSLTGPVTVTIDGNYTGMDLGGLLVPGSVSASPSYFGGPVTMHVTGDFTSLNSVTSLSLSGVLAGDDSPTDKLVIDGNTAGTTKVFYRNLGGTGAQTINGIRIIEVGGTSAAEHFALAAPVQAGAYEYTLHRGQPGASDNHFYLRSEYTDEPPTQMLRPAVPGYVQGPGVMGEVGFGLMGSPAQRELVSINAPSFRFARGDQGLERHAPQMWMSYNGAKPSDANLRPGVRASLEYLDTNGARQFSSEQRIVHVQAGRDLIHHGHEGANGVTGASVGYGNSSASFFDRLRTVQEGQKTGTLDGHILSFGGYHTRQMGGGLYMDVTAQLLLVNNSYTDSTGGKGKQKGTGLALGAELGRKVELGGNWSVQPQAHLAYQHVRYGGFDHRDPQGADMSVGAMSSELLRGRAGAEMVWSVKTGPDAGKLRLHFSAHALRDFKVAGAATVAGVRVSDEAESRSWFELGMGGQMALSKTAALHGALQYQRSFSGDARKGFALQAGVKLNW